MYNLVSRSLNININYYVGMPEAHRPLFANQGLVSMPENRDADSICSGRIHLGRVWAPPTYIEKIELKGVHMEHWLKKIFTLVQFYTIKFAVCSLLKISVSLYLRL